MSVNKNMESTLKKALVQRQTVGLPSNFSFRMMKQIRVEAQKIEKRKKRIAVLFLGITIVTLIALVVYCLFFYLDFRIIDLFPRWNLLESSFSLLGFYSYIALLALGLLGIDYWIRKKKKSI